MATATLAIPQTDSEKGISQQLERLTEAYLMAIIPLAEYQRRRSELEEKSQALEAQTKELEAQADRQAELVQLGSSIEDFCRRIHAGLVNATFDPAPQFAGLLQFADGTGIRRVTIHIDHAIRKGQIRLLAKGDAVGQRQFIHALFGIAV